MTGTSSEYINQQRREYALFVMQMRAIPSITDGLKSGARRVLWTARDRHKWKSATLAGATLPIHPHDAPNGSINTITAPYGNNIPLFKGTGAFGTLLDATAYGASRYTSVTLSAFTKDVVMRDIEIVPMVDNYDSTEKEPKHFLPLVPLALVNPAEGIAVGFATNILPRDLGDIIRAQLKILQGTSVEDLDEIFPEFTPSDNTAHDSIITDGGIAYYFSGNVKILTATTVLIDKIPYGQTHKKVISKLESEYEKGNIVDYTDGSRDTVNITVKFHKGYLATHTNESLLLLLGLTVRHIENLNVLDFNHSAVLNLTPLDLLARFTKWRLAFYVDRYLRLLSLLEVDIQKYKDIITAIDNNIGGISKKTQSRSELKELLVEIGVVYIDYIADLPVYRFTKDEYTKTLRLLEEANTLKLEYENIIGSKDRQREIYMQELNEVLQKYTKGKY
jgi:DNA gyrase subunit A